jgi:hypothetical protein
MMKRFLTILALFLFAVAGFCKAQQCCTAYTSLAFSNCADHNCEGALLFGATGPNGGHAIYAPYGVCSDLDILRNIGDCWLTNYRGCDFNGDGIVNFNDYAIMLNLWRNKI